MLMTGADFERRIKRLGRQRGVAVSFDRGHGKRSHGRLYYGGRFATLKDHQLGLTGADLESR
jgi:hypothetical protein